MLRLIKRILWGILSYLHEIIYLEELLLAIVDRTIVVLLLPIRLPYRLLETVRRALRRGLTGT
ncbi:hypothetical protein [Methanopyrus kandleri]|uniref:Uncharacterized protein n=1 Tax=Methanopyrus kandleri (strain AV19 / DSM 6324 / JCM 9639 / NBRC 100938) TaxID=190192 RepID=Q8TVQ1_METKA|nr:hypothetical protein [Methanopyrus kandleri]AAM02550.1 Uncharacterized protein MK1337 [Methanopyrus kandleri AV19]